MACILACTTWLTRQMGVTQLLLLRLRLATAARSLHDAFYLYTLALAVYTAYLSMAVYTRCACIVTIYVYTCTFNLHCLPCDSAARASRRKWTSTVSYTSAAPGQAALMIGAYASNTSGLLSM